ncbi:hypothetical protein MBANPS3_005941 [Mucor bainieri]
MKTVYIAHALALGKTNMSNSSSEANKNAFSDVVGGLCEEQKALIKELDQLKQQNIALLKHETELKHALQMLDKDRDEIAQAMLRWVLIFKDIKQMEDKVRESRRTLDRQTTRVKDKIALFENLLPSADRS